MSDIVSDIKKNSGEYGSLPFWSWNDRLEPDELRRQIRDMKRIGMNGFFMHARSGLETEYLSDEWFSCVDACVDEAKKLGMEAWSYDENGWPSGFAGGELLHDEENLARYLKYGLLDRFDENAFAVYVIENGKARLITSPGDYREYHTVYKHLDVSYVDTLDDNITRKFIALTHKKYKERLGDDFGGAMPGFFTDEPQYFRWETPYSERIPDEFSKRFGYDVMSGLAALFIDYDGAREFRYDYHKLCHELFINNFIKVIYDWCDENGAFLTGHAVEERSLYGQMWCCGGVMPFYEYEHIPGVDFLGRGIGSDLSSKQVGSVAAQLGKKKVLSEMFACCGWDVSPNELKLIAEHQYSGGVNLMCQHLYPYSERGQRKRDYPAHYSEHLPWQDSLGEFNGYFNRLGYLLSRGEESVNTLVIHPIHSCYLDYRRKEDRNSVLELEEGIDALTNLLSQNQIAYHFGDENLMKKYASVEGDKIRVGNCVYDYIVLPLIYTLDGSTAALIKEFLSNGGRLFAYSLLPDRIDGRVADMPWLTANMTFDELRAAAEIKISDRFGGNEAFARVMIRSIDEKRMFYILNQSLSPIGKTSVKIDNCSSLSVLDLETLEYYAPDGAPAPDGSFELSLEFNPVQSYILIEGIKSDKKYPKISGEIIPLPEEMNISGTPENALTLDFARVSYDGESFGDRLPLMLIKDNLLREKYEGRLWLKFDFDICELPEKLSLAAEPLPYFSISVNGSDISLSDTPWLDKSFKTADLSALLKSGRNEIVFGLNYFQRPYVYYVLYGNVTESLRNCLNFDTEIECVYLFGDFSVWSESEYTPKERKTVVTDGGFCIKKQKKTVKCKNIVTDGYPFFTGSMPLYFDYEYKKGMPTLLSLGGKYAVCDISVNGKNAGRCMFNHTLDLLPLLTEGDNRIELVLYNSRRNLLGPHHHIGPDPYPLNPLTFSFESMWKDGKCDDWLDRYAFVRFGVESEEKSL